MIEVNQNFKPMCHTCSEFKPNMRVATSYADNQVLLTFITISCKYRNFCDRIEKELTK